MARTASTATPSPGTTSASSARVGVWQIFAAFLLIGATSVGGGVVAHLRTRLVARRQWMDDTTFVELLALSQSLPGLIATNMAVLIGDRLRGTAGAIAAIAGICLPGAMVMYIVGVVYQIERDRPLLEAGLEGVAAAAVGLILATTLQLGRRSLSRVADVVFVVLTVVCVNRLHLRVPVALIAVGALAIVWYAFVDAPDARPRR